MLPESDPASIPQIGFDDGFVRFVGDAVVVEVVPAGGAAALAGVGPVAPFVQVGLIHLQVAVAVAGAGGVAGEQGGELVAQALVDGLLLGVKAIVGQQVLVGAVELELCRVDALVYLIELFGIDQAVGGTVHAADAYQLVILVAQCALVMGEEDCGGLALILQIGVDRAAGAEAVGIDGAAGAVPDTALVLAYTLLGEYLHTGVGGGDDAGGRGLGTDIGALFGEVGAADGLVLWFGEVGHDRLGVQLQCAGQGRGIDAGDFPEQAEQVGAVDHMGHVAVVVRDHRPGDDQRYPDAGLVQRALGPQRVEGQFDGGHIGAVVAGDDDHGVAVGVVLQGAVLALEGNAGADQQAPDFMVHGFEHVLGHGALLGEVGQIDGGVGQYAQFGQAVGHGCTTADQAEGGVGVGQQAGRWRLQGRVQGGVAEAEHPGLVGLLFTDVVEPLDGQIGFQNGAVAPGFGLVGAQLAVAAVGQVDLPGTGVVAVLGGEVQFVAPGFAVDSGAWIKNAAQLQTGTARSGVLVRIGHQQVAAIAVARGQVADAVIGAIVDVRRGVGHKAAVVGAGRGDPAGGGVDRVGRAVQITGKVDRKSTRLNSSHVRISYAVFC